MTDEYMIKIPADRIAVLIGPNGKTRKKIEALTESKLSINSETGEVIITVDTEKLEDPLNAWKAKDMVKAIARGFSPEKAFQLSESNYAFELIRLRDFGINTPNAAREVRSRLIGKHGRARQTIEDITGTYISVYGNTVGIIGDYRNVEIAREGIIKLIRGSSHGRVFKFLENKMREAKRDEMRIWVSHGNEEDLSKITDLDELERLVFSEEEKNTKE